MISLKLATLAELKTVYNYRDLLDLYEIAEVDSINEKRAHDAARKKVKANGK